MSKLVIGGSDQDPMIAACSELAEASQNAPCPSHLAETD